MKLKIELSDKKVPKSKYKYFHDKPPNPFNRRPILYKSAVQNLNNHMLCYTAGHKNIIYSMWYCGITDNPFTRPKTHKRKFGNIRYYHYVQLKNNEDAHKVEVYFNKKGTLNSTNMGGATEKSVYAYVFKFDFKISSARKKELKARGIIP